MVTSIWKAIRLIACRRSDAGNRDGRRLRRFYRCVSPHSWLLSELIPPPNIRLAPLGTRVEKSEICSHSKTMAIVERSAELAAPAEAVWRAVKTPSAFRTVTRGILTMPVIKHRDDGWRDGETVQGMTLSSQESGGISRRWNHDIVVRPVNDAGCHYTDRIDIDAGIFTPFVAGYARWFYKMRQQSWRELAKELAKEVPGSPNKS